MDPKQLLERVPVVPFAPGTRIPWDEPGFSRRMLREHLSQADDRASRPFDVVDRQVAWLHDTVLRGETGQILDLGCGPGLYTSRLARLGHECVGIDFSPASIDYARDDAARNELACEYRLGDVGDVDFGSGFAAVSMWFGEFNTLAPSTAENVLQRASRALAPGGRIVLELHDEDYVQEIGELPPSWSAHPSGVFADKPYLALRECQWHPEVAAATERYFIETSDGEVAVFIQTTQAYSEDQFDRILDAASLTIHSRYGSLTGDSNGDSDDDLDADSDGDAQLFGIVLEPA